MAESADIHPTAGRRRREKGPPSGLALPRLERVSDTECEHSENSAGEKEAKRQRSEPSTPVSTPRPMPYDYDALMGITRVGTREAEGFDEDLDSTEYHDANDTTEDPTRKDETECTVSQQRSEDSLTDANAQPSSGSISQEVIPVAQPSDGSISQKVPQVKDEPLSPVKCEPVKEIKTESSSSTREVKVEQKESENKGESMAAVKQEEHAPEPDSEDSFTPEKAVEAIQRLLDARESRTGEREQVDEEREMSSPRVNPRERVSGSETSRGQEYGPYAPQGARRARRRYDSPDPFLFSTTIFLEHDADANEMRDDPMGNLHCRLRCVEHNIETLRTRLTQVVDLRDTQGIRQDHRAIVARLEEVEEYASASTFREFMTKIQRLESMLLNDGGGTIGEAIRVCTRRIDQQQATLDDVRSRVRAQEGNIEWSEENSENISGRVNRVADRRRRGAPAQGIFRSPMPRPPPLQTSETSRMETDQQALNRLFTAYNQCVGRTGHLENRFDQFRFDIRRDATDLAIVVQAHDQRVNAHSRELRQLTECLEEAQSRIAGLDTLTKTILAHDHHVTQTIDKNTHSQTASIVGLIQEQEDLRKMVEELASRFDRSQDSLSTPQSEASTGVLLDIGDLKTKVARLTEQQTRMDGEVSFLNTLHDSVEELGRQIVKWNNRLPDLNDVTDEDGDKVPTAIEVQEELTSLTNISFTKFHNLFNWLQALENMVGTLEQSREESWEAVSNRVSTLVESSVTSLSGRLTELEQALHSQRTTPIESEDVGVDADTWAASEQVIWAELGKVKEQLQDVPRLQVV